MKQARHLAEVTSPPYGHHIILVLALRQAVVLRAQSTFTRGSRHSAEVYFLITRTENHLWHKPCTSRLSRARMALDSSGSGQEAEAFRHKLSVLPKGFFFKQDPIKVRRKYDLR